MRQNFHLKSANWHKWRKMGKLLFKVNYSIKQLNLIESYFYVESMYCIMYMMEKSCLIECLMKSFIK